MIEIEVFEAMSAEQQQQALSLLSFSERQQLRKMQFAFRVSNAARTQFQQKQRLKEEKAAAQKKRQAMNKAAHAHEQQQLRNVRSRSSK